MQPIGQKRERWDSDPPIANRRARQKRIDAEMIAEGLDCTELSAFDDWDLEPVWAHDDVLQAMNACHGCGALGECYCRYDDWYNLEPYVN